MPNFRDLTPEQRAENVRKSKETRERNRAARDSRKAGREAAPKRQASFWPPGLTKAKVTRVMHATVVGLDAGLAILTPDLWLTPADRLNEDEANLLAVALSEEAARHPAALRVLNEITKYGQRAGIIGALLIIAIPRLQRRGLIPGFLVTILTDVAGAATAQDIEPHADTPAEPEIAPREEPGPDRAAA